MAASVAMRRDHRSPKRAALTAMPRRSLRAAHDAFAKFPTKADVARNDLFDQRWSVWGAPSAAAATPEATRRWDRTTRPRARSVSRPAPTTASRAIRWPVLRSPAAAPISASTVSAPDVRTCSRPAPSCATISGAAYVTGRRGLWLAGRHHRAHGHGGRLRPPARPVQRQRLFGPHRGRLPLS